MYGLVVTPLATKPSLKVIFQGAVPVSATLRLDGIPLHKVAEPEIDEVGVRI
jgi:hypothetical protein